jgi:hypothetical protein
MIARETVSRGASLTIQLGAFAKPHRFHISSFDSADDHPHYQGEIF